MTNIEKQMFLGIKNMRNYQLECGLTFWTLLKSMSRKYHRHKIFADFIFQIKTFDTFQMYFSMRFRLWLKWIDQRQCHENLAEEWFQNKLPDNQATKLWKPMISFKNNVEGKMLKFHPTSSDIFLKKTGQSQVAEPHHYHEAKVYASNETDIIWSSAHLMKFKCQFDLFFLPFDNQT